MRTSLLSLLFDLASLEARSAFSSALDTPHLFLGLAKSCDLKLQDVWENDLPDDLVQNFAVQQRELAQAFERAGVMPQPFRRRLRYEIHKRGQQGTSAEEPIPDNVLHRTRAAKAAFERAVALQVPTDTSPRLVHLLQALAERPDAFWLNVWREFNSQPPHQALFGVPAPALESAASAQPSPQALSPQAPSPQALALTPTLDRYGRDLSAEARAGRLQPVWGRDDEVRRLAQILASARKGNALLIGDAGVGKTAVVEALAHRLTSTNASSGLENLRIIEVPLTGLLAGASYRGEWEERLQRVLQEAQQPGIVLFFDEIHTLVGAGGQGVSDASQIVKPALARGTVRVIGATTPAEYARTIERDAALARRFETLWIAEPSPENTLYILRHAKVGLEAHHGVTFEESALAAAVELSVRLLPDLRLPDKALDALDAAASAVRFHTLSYVPGMTPQVIIGREAVAATIAQRARLPLEQVQSLGVQRLHHLGVTLKHRVVGQDEAIDRITNALKLSFFGLKSAHQPQGVFLFVGASGSGKTELAKALATALYGDESALLRFDMGEYGEAHTVSRLLGSPPGYVGHEQEGELSVKLRSRPASIVLFDEVEKAHPDLWNLFLPLFDEGYLTDARGRRLDFSQTVVVLTSNLGTGIKPRPIGFRAQEAVADAKSAFEAEVLSTVQNTLRPELLGRIQETIVFAPLDTQARQRVTEMILQEVANRAAQRGVRLEWTPEVVALLAKKGFDERTGVRPLRREIERCVALPLAHKVLGRAELNGTIACVKVAGQDLHFVIVEG